MICARPHPPARLTLAEARQIVTDPQVGATTHPLLRMDAWARLKADHAARRRRATLTSQPGPTPGDAA